MKILKKITLLLFAASMTLCTMAHAAYSQDSGRIVQLFANTQGAVAIVLDAGYPNAIAAKQCLAGDGGWAGVTTADPIFKATLLMAKQKGSVVVVTTEGCESGWLKIIDIYVR
jgi:hypothetical protein